MERDWKKCKRDEVRAGRVGGEVGREGGGAM
jgi:hypothetical protein